MSKIIALIANAGCGKRFGGDIPKQYTLINDQTILERTVKAFVDTQIFHEIVVIASLDDNYVDSIANINNKIIIKKIGGMTRAQSVFNGLKSLQCNDDDWIVVHDAARCLITPALIRNSMNIIYNDEIGGIVATPINDTVKLVTDNCLSIESTLNRDRLYLAQTPQFFRFGILYQAFNQACNNNTLNTITDESSLIEQSGFQVLILPGDKNNLKITTADDCVLAQHILNIRGKQS